MPTLTLREQIEAGHKAVADRAAFIEQLGDRATSDDWANLETMTTELAGHLSAFDKQNETRGVQGRARALLDELAGIPTSTAPGRFEALAQGTGVAAPRGMTVGQAFVESPAYQEALARAGNDGMGGFGGKSTPVNFGMSLTTMHRNLQFEADVDGRPRNALVTGLSDTSGGSFTYPTHTGVLSDSAAFRDVSLWDVCTKIPITSDVFDYVEVTAKTNNAAFVLEATSSGIISATGTVVTAVEAGQKPESSLALAVRTVAVENIAHLTYITRRAAADAPRLMTIIEMFLRDGLAVKIDDQLLLGNGTSPNLRGIINATNPYSISVFDMSVNSVTSRLVAVLRAIATVRSFGYRPTAIVINSADWFNTNFLALQDSTGSFILGDPRSSADQLSTLWGLQVVVNDGITAGTQLVGDFRQAAIGDREQAALYMSDSNRDLFERNILTLLAEQRLGFGVLAPKAFCTVVA